MTHPIELHTARAVQRLRRGHRAKRKPSELFLTKQIYFCWDPQGGEVALETWHKPGMLFGAKATISDRVSDTPAWMSFNLALHKGRFEAGDILGLTLEYEGFAGDTLPLFIRSARNGGISDSYLHQPLQGHKHRAVQTLLHSVHGHSALCGPTAFHTLVFPLPSRDFRFVLYDLRLFVLPAERGLHLGPDRLGTPK